jgi:hypothetical protein
VTRPREQQVSLTDTPYYHVVSRCVRAPISAARIVTQEQVTNTAANGVPIVFVFSRPYLPLIFVATQ